ncbi:PspC domain-containing protein [Mycobacteroides abscessus]
MCQGVLSAYGKFMTTTALRRPRTGKMIGGVCAAFAQRFGWDVTIVRVLAVASILLPGPQVLAYLALWVLIPREQ